MGGEAFAMAEISEQGQVHQRPVPAHPLFILANE